MNEDNGKHEVIENNHIMIELDNPIQPTDNNFFLHDDSHYDEQHKDDTNSALNNSLVVSLLQMIKNSII